MKKKKPTVKILVGYHRPAVLLKDEVLTPIHLGRALATEASKDGSMSKEDYQWMLDNMIGDDTGENISEENRKYCELTALYWAWKNYDKLGNPDYIGFMQYRRHFIFDDGFDGTGREKPWGCFRFSGIDDSYVDAVFSQSGRFAYLRPQSSAAVSGIQIGNQKISAVEKALLVPQFYYEKGDFFRILRMAV